MSPPKHLTLLMAISINLQSYIWSTVGHSGVPTHSEVCHKTPMCLTNSDPHTIFSKYRLIGLILNLQKIIHFQWPHRVMLDVVLQNKAHFWQKSTFFFQFAYKIYNRSPDFGWSKIQTRLLHKNKLINYFWAKQKKIENIGVRLSILARKTISWKPRK